MRIAFHAPLKPPGHPVPSGDRRMARSLVALLGDLGHDVTIPAAFRSYDRSGDAVRQARLAALGGRWAARLLRRFRKRPSSAPELWFTYHVYHKAPDHLGPVVSRALGIPYVIAEASDSPGQAAGPWASGRASALVAFDEADVILAMTAKDRVGLEAVVVPPTRLGTLRPFLDVRPLAEAASHRDGERAQLALAVPGLDPAKAWLLAVGMMRNDAKLQSYLLLADTLERLDANDWQLLLVGEGPARPELEARFATLGDCFFMGELPPARLAGVYAAADLLVWPAFAEAYGMSLLEAQAAGCPIVAGAEGGVPDIVVDGITGLLVPPREPAAFAEAVATLLRDPARRGAMAAAGPVHAAERHGLDAAATTLRDALAEAIVIRSNRHPAP